MTVNNLNNLSHKLPRKLHSNSLKCCTFVSFLQPFDSRTMRSIVCESMLSDMVAMENQTALCAAWLCNRAWFLETRLFHTVQVPHDFQSTLRKM